MIQILSVVVCIIIGFGLYWRHRRNIHMPLMLTAFALDLGMVLYIELTRHAINTTLHPPHPFVIFHVFLSVVALLLYFSQIASGFKLLRGINSRRFHMISGILFVVFRLGNLITSFYVEQYVVH